jgi:hypothetical protein
VRTAPSRTQIVIVRNRRAVTVRITIVRLPWSQRVNGIRRAEAIAARALLILVLVTCLTSCQSIADVRPGNGHKTTTSGKTYDEVWDAAYKTANEDFEIQHQDKRHGTILGEVPRGAWGSGGWVGIYLTPSTTGAGNYTLEVVWRKRRLVRDIGEREWGYVVLRDICHALGLQAPDPNGHP